MGVGGGALGGHGGGGTPVGVKIAGGPGWAGGVLSFDEFFRFPGVGVFFGKRLRVALQCGRGS